MIDNKNKHEIKITKIITNLILKESLIADILKFDGGTAGFWETQFEYHGHGRSGNDCNSLCWKERDAAQLRQFCHVHISQSKTYMNTVLFPSYKAIKNMV